MCSKCGEDKSAAHFRNRLTFCRKCEADVNTAKIIERRAILKALKQERGCTDCGYEEDGDVLEFDHLPQYEKSFTIGSAVSNKGIDTLLKEIEKCEVVCANCHRKRTMSRLRDRRTKSISNLVRSGKWDPVQKRHGFQGVFVFA